MRSTLNPLYTYAARAKRHRSAVAADAVQRSMRRRLLCECLEQRQLMAADLAADYLQPLPHEFDAHGMLDVSDLIAHGEINHESIRSLLQDANLHESQGSNSVRGSSRTGKFDALAAASVSDSSQLGAASLALDQAKPYLAES